MFWACSPLPSTQLLAHVAGLALLGDTEGPTPSPPPQPCSPGRCSEIQQKFRGCLLGTSTFLPGFGLAGGMCERHLEPEEAAGPSGTAFNYHEPQPWE